MTGWRSETQSYGDREFPAQNASSGNRLGQSKSFRLLPRTDIALVRRSYAHFYRSLLLSAPRQPSLVFG